MKRVIRFFKKLAIGIGIFVGIVVIMLGIAWFIGNDVFKSSGSATRATVQKSATQSMTLGHTLAIIDKGYVPRDDITVIRFKSLLEQLDAVYIENKQELADLTVAAQTRLKNKYGIKETLLHIMEDLNRVQVTKSSPSYRLYVVGYMGMRGSGLPRKNAVELTESFLKSVGRF